MRSLGFVEIPSLSLSAVVADRMATTANVELLGFEPVGNECVLIRIAGSNPSNVGEALEVAEREAMLLGVTAVTRRLSRPDPGIPALNAGRNSINPLYGGREQFLPTDHQPNLFQTMNHKSQAIGILETQGLTASLEAADAMLKAANVQLIGKEKIGAAYVTVIIQGDVAAVAAAIAAGKTAVGSLGKLIAAHVIARPHADLVALLPPPVSIAK